MISIDEKIVSVRLAEKSAPTPKPETKPFPTIPKNNKIQSAKVYRLKGTTEHALYVTISDITIEGKTYPYNIFFNSKDPTSTMWTNAITLLISSLFRQHIETGLNLDPILENLSQVYDRTGGYWTNIDGEHSTHVNSIVAEVGLCITRHLHNIQSPMEQSSPKTPSLPCPQCGSPLKKEAGCEQCTVCDYSKCS